MRTGPGAVAALVLVAAVVNLPLAHHVWQQRQIDADGRSVTAEVTGADVLRADTDPHYVLRFRLPASIDSERRTWPVEVDRATWDAADASGQVAVRVLPDQPSAHRVAGQRSSSLGVVVIVSVDLVLVALAVLLWWRRRAGSDGAGPA